MIPLVPILGAVFGAVALSGKGAWNRDDYVRQGKWESHLHFTGEGVVHGVTPKPPKGGWQRDAYMAGWRATEAAWRSMKSRLPPRMTHGRGDGFFGGKYPARWGVPSGAFLKPGEVPPGWDPNLFAPGMPAPFGHRAGFGLDNDQKLNMGPEYRRWGPMNESEFVTNPLDEPASYDAHFDGLGTDSFSGVDPRGTTPDFLRRRFR